MINSIIKQLFKKEYPKWAAALYDFSINTSILLAYNLYEIENFKSINLFFILSIPLLNLIISYLIGVYNTSIRFYTIDNLFLLIASSIASFLFFIQLKYTTSFLSDFTIKDLMIVYYLSLSLFIGFRFFIKVVYRNIAKNDVKNVLVYGGQDLNQIINFLNQNQFYKIIGVITDGNQKIKSSGFKTYDLDHNLISIIITYNISKILIPENLDVQKIEFLYKLNDSIKIDIIKFPKQNKLLDRLSEFSLNPLDIEDLLSRDQIQLNIENIKKEYTAKKIMITGGAGSIGSEIIRQLAKFNPSEIIVIDNAETPMFDLHSELSNNSQIKFNFLVESILDNLSLKRIIKDYKPDIIFHAAAYKHVSMMEQNVGPAIINNILGTKNLFEAVLDSSASKIIFISTDKAVNPSSVMGVTKRICEIYISKYFNQIEDIVITRFGNVLGSNGSVVNIFKDQIRKGGPVTVTDPKVNRYFMTIPEASQLVLEAGSMGEKGEIFVFDMGDPVNISDLAKKMINLSGYQVNKDIQIKYIGLRHGEKLYEELLTKDEKLKKSYNPLIMIADKDTVESETYERIDDLILLAKQKLPNEKLVELMKEIVKEYKPLNSIYK